MSKTLSYVVFVFFAVVAISVVSHGVSAKEPVKIGFSMALTGGLAGGGKQAYPNEVHSDFAFLPFGGGSRKCVGDQFAMMESTATLVQILRRFDFELLSKPEDVGMRTGATIHTENNLPMRITIRKQDCKDVKQE